MICLLEKLELLFGITFDKLNSIKRYSKVHFSIFALPIKKNQR